MKPLQRFYGLLKLDRKDITQIILYAMLGGLVSLTLPLGIQAIINFIQSARVSTSWIILVVMVVLGVAFVGVLRYMQFRLAEIIQQKLFVRSAFEFAYRFPRMAYQVLMKNYLPELANRFFDTVSIQKGYAKILLEISTAALQVVFGLILLTFYHPYFIAFGLLMTLMLFIIFKINFYAGLK
ncbi:MAG: ABC transporter ATP-binding protein, partial [Flavobacteriaceae bacterium]|nr:ABC transporter ATP-binding protein [Flavobacteriaceae bacterium]